MNVPMSPLPYQRFSVSLDGQNVDFYIRWNESGQLFMVDIYLDDVPVIQGRGLHLFMDLLENIPVTGSAILEGDVPTPDNLGIDNRLVYVSEV